MQLMLSEFSKLEKYLKSQRIINILSLLLGESYQLICVKN